MARASATLKKCTLECGGKSANIVLDDADLAMAVGTARSTPSTTTRVSAARPDARPSLPAATTVVASCSRIFAKMKIGYLKYARRKAHISGFETLPGSGQTPASPQALPVAPAGGGIPKVARTEKGFDVEPTLFTGVTNSMTIAREEIFGPVLSVIPYSGRRGGGHGRRFDASSALASGPADG